MILFFHVILTVDIDRKYCTYSMKTLKLILRTSNKKWNYFPSRNYCKQVKNLNITFFGTDKFSIYPLKKLFKIRFVYITLSLFYEIIERNPPLVLSVLQDNTTALLHSFMVCMHCFYFRYTKSWNFRISTAQIDINTKPNDKQKWSEERIKLPFYWLVISLAMYLKSIEIRTDHKRVEKMKSSAAVWFSSN